MEKVYKVGIIGCGGISHMHTNWYRAEPYCTDIDIGSCYDVEDPKFLVP